MGGGSKEQSDVKYFEWREEQGESIKVELTKETVDKDMPLVTMAEVA